MTMTSRLPLQPSWMSTESYSLLLLLISAMLFSTMGVFLKLASNSGLPATELVLFRAMYQGVFVVLGLLHWSPTSIAEGGDEYLANSSSGSSGSKRILLQTPFGGTPKVQNVVIARGIFGGVGFVMYFVSIKMLPLGDAITLFSIYPIITIALAAIMLGEQVRSVHVLATTASLAGAIFIARPTFIFGISSSNMNTDDGNDDSELSSSYYWVGYITAMIGSCCGAAVMTLIRKAGTIGAHALQLLFSWAVFGISASIVFGFLLQSIDGVWYIPTSSRVWMYLIAMGTVGSCAHFLMNYAGRLAPAGLGSIVRSSDIVWAYMWEIVVFGQMPQPLTWFGVALILVSLGAVAVQKFWDEQEKKRRISDTMADEASTLLSAVHTNNDNDTNGGDNSNSDSRVDYGSRTSSS